MMRLTELFDKIGIKSQGNKFLYWVTNSRFYFKAVEILIDNLAFLILGTYLIIGSIILPDYGISTDEPIQRKHGIISFDYINQKYNIFPGIAPTYEESLPEYEYRDYGVVFQVFCYGLEKLFKIDDALSVFLLRHILTFMLFWVSVFYFFKTTALFFESKAIQLIGLIFYILCPRIFVEAFYNPKDIILLSWITIGIYSMIRFVVVGSPKYLFGHALICALAINSRIVGIVLPGVTVLYSVLLIKSNGLGNWIRFSGIKILWWGALTILLTYIIWPVLWNDPVRNFLYSFNEMKRFRWGGNVLLWGKIVNATNLPWHYTLSEILVTTPILYSILFLTGVILIIKMVITRRFLNYKNGNERNLSMILLLFLIPCVSVIYFHSVLYNGWRQMYFIYPSFLLISLTGLVHLIRIVRSLQNQIFRNISRAVIFCCVLISLGSTMNFLITMHPYQYIYFNKLAGTDPLRQFDGDYFGLSYKNALKYLLCNLPEDTVRIHVANSSGIINKINFREQDVNRLLYVDDIKDADYYITTYYFPSSPQNFQYYLEGAEPFNKNLIFSKSFHRSKFIGIYLLE